MDAIIKTEKLTFAYDRDYDRDGDGDRDGDYDHDGDGDRDGDREQAGGGQIGLVLNELDLSIEKGTFTAIIGHNGSGKTTLAKHFNAILLPGGGRVLVDNMDTTDEALLLEVRRRVGMVFQNPDNQIVATVVEEDVAFAPENLGIPSGEIRRRVDEALKTVDMFDYKTHAPHLLSGGQKQRIAIAGVLAMNPKCIVFDEPTAMLDPCGREKILEIMCDLSKNHAITVVLITHHMSEAAAADRLIVMSDGKIIKDGPPSQVFLDVDAITGTGLSIPAASLLLHKLKEDGFDIPLGALSVDDCAAIIKDSLPWAKSAAGKAAANTSGKASLSASGEASSSDEQRVNRRDVLIKTEKLSHTYSVGTPFEHTALQGVDIEIQKGEYIGIIGATGSGKSTLISHLNGLLKPTSGTVYIDGVNIHESKQHTRDVRFKVGLVFQYPEYQLFETTVFEDIAFGPKNMGLDEQEVKQRVLESAGFVGLTEAMLDKSPFELSGGQKRRAAIAGVIAMRPQVLILDEPTAGLDPRGQAEIIKNISDYKKAHNATIILITHNMNEIARSAGRLLVLSKGRIIMDGTPGEVFSRTKELEELSLSAPKASLIAARLHALGVPVDTSVYTIEQLRQSLLALAGVTKTAGGVSNA